MNVRLPIRWRKVRRDLWFQKAKTLLMIMSISLGVIGVGMIGQSQNILLEGMKESYNASNPSHLSVYSEPFDRGIVQIVRQIPGVKAVEARRLVAVKARKGGEVTNIENKTDW